MKEKNISRIYWLVNLLLLKAIFTPLWKTILISERVKYFEGKDGQKLYSNKQVEQLTIQRC